MGLFNSLIDFLTGIWLNIYDLFILIMVIAYIALFFTAQYFLIKSYIWLTKKSYALYKMLKPYIFDRFISKEE